MMTVHRYICPPIDPCCHGNENKVLEHIIGRKVESYKRCPKFLNHTWRSKFSGVVGDWTVRITMSRAKDSSYNSQIFRMQQQQISSHK